MVGVCVVRFVAVADEPEESARVSLPRLIPWIEVNTIGEDAVDNAAAGLAVWGRITDTAIVSTVPGCDTIYRRLRGLVPGMRIIPGMKTSRCMSRFDSVEGWKKVAHEVRLVCAASGEKRVALENEGAVKGYWRGEYEIDLDRLRAGLNELPKDIEFIWYPALVGENETAQDRTEAVCRIVSEVLNVRFTDFSAAGPRSLRYGWTLAASKRMKQVARNPTIPILYFHGPGSRWWQDDQIHEALAATEGKSVIVYPGITRWREAARSFVDTLLKGGVPERP